jgi:hypothetical protein
MDEILKLQLLEILKRKKFGMTYEELIREFKEAGRLAPCLYFSALPPRCCKLRRELNCPSCPEYKHHETPGPLTSAICRFSSGRIYHAMRYTVSDGFFRRGETFCGREIDESEMDVEVLDMPYSGHRLCKKCLAKM